MPQENYGLFFAKLQSINSIVWTGYQPLFGHCTFFGHVPTPILQYGSNLRNLLTICICGFTIYAKCSDSSKLQICIVYRKKCSYTFLSLFAGNNLLKMPSILNTWGMCCGVVNKVATGLNTKFSQRFKDTRKFPLNIIVLKQWFIVSCFLIFAFFPNQSDNFFLMRHQMILGSPRAFFIDIFCTFFWLKNKITLCSKTT